MSLSHKGKGELLGAPGTASAQPWIELHTVYTLRINTLSSYFYIYKNREVRLHGVVGGTLTAVIFCLACLRSTATCLSSFSSMLFIGSGGCSRSSFASSFQPPNRSGKTPQYNLNNINKHWLY